MEKETDKREEVLLDEENVGVIQIADDVVAMIASLAATEAEGISSIADNMTNEIISRVGMKKLAKGVKVDVLEGNVSVRLEVVMEYGYNIPDTCKAVQAKVKAAIENMTGLSCSDVNIRIAGVKREEVFERPKTPARPKTQAKPKTSAKPKTPAGNN